MLEIKTILTKANDPEAFDREVNSLLAKGWVLVKRDVLPETPSWHRSLYAELEKEELPEAEQAKRRSCYTCKWSYKISISEPCRNCIDGDRWEPKP